MNTQEEKMKLLADMIAFSVVDGRLHEREYQFVWIVAQELGIGKNEFNVLDSELDIKSGTSRERFQIVHELICSAKADVLGEMTEKHGKIKILPRINNLIDDRAKGFKFQKALT